MFKTVLGSKGKMGQTYVSGTRVPVTCVSITPSVVTQVKTSEKDGYWSVQLGFGNKRIKSTSKPLQGHLKKTSTKEFSPKFLREIRLEGKAEANVGDQVNANDIFKVGDKIAVKGVSKGKGFAGVVKRWHFAGGPKTHGQSDRQRAPGSIGQTTTPGRVVKGKHMAGRMGGDGVTVKNLHIISIDPTKNEMFVSGAIPGKFGDLLILTKISEGSLKDLEREVVAKVVEGEGAKIAGGATAAPTAPAPQEGGTNA
jgi:large subunit ribosomal protein L3